MAEALILEAVGEDKTRAIIIDVSEPGRFFVANIFEADAANLDALWALVADQHPNLNAVLTPDGEIIEADCLTLREAAEAVFSA